MKNKIIQKSGSIIDKSSKIGGGSVIWHGAQIARGAKIGKGSIIGNNVYIDVDVIVGKNCKIQSGASLFFGLEIGDGVFIGPHVCFTNDKLPRAIDVEGKRNTKWKVSKTKVMGGASIGANSTILPGVTIGKFAMIGAGSVVTKDIPAFALVYGNPAKVYGKVGRDGKKIANSHLKYHKNDKR